MLIKLPKRHLDTIVLGGTLPALLYSHQNNLPIIINDICRPHRFEKTGDENSIDVWNKTYYSLSLAGLNLLGDKTQSVRIKDEEMSASTIDARVIKFTYNNVIIFDDEKVSGLPMPKKENDDFIVLDWMFVRSCQKHNHDYLTTDDKLVSEVYFYPTDRIDGNHMDTKDLVTLSHLNKEQLEDFEYSDTYARFKIMSMLRGLGLRGRHNGGGNYCALKVEVSKREIRKSRMHSYEDTETMEFK